MAPKTGNVELKHGIVKVKHLLFSIIAAAFLTSAISFDKTIEVGSKAPKIETKEGTNVGYDANSTNKTKLISFWNPKKPASRITNRKLSRQYGENSDNIEFISICTDPDVALMKEVVKIDGLNVDEVYSYSEISPRVFKDYNVEDVPKAYMISPEGKIVEIF